MHYRDTACENERRRFEAGIMGIDYIEVNSESLESQRFLQVHFLGDLVPDELVDHPEKIKVEGGVRIKGIKAIAAKKVAHYLQVEVDRPGDFFNYTLVIEGLGLDRMYSICEFSFKAGCPSNLDCQSSLYSEQETRVEPLIDYNAKDYASFRRALLDRASVLIPDWKEIHEADFGIVLLELLAYAGDQLSYYQDAVANEAFLETARQRISVRRHANLIDYRMHDGVSARVFVHFEVTTPLLLPRGTELLTHIDKPFGILIDPPGTLIPDKLRADAMRVADAVFESTQDVQLSPNLKEIPIHTWGNEVCCLLKGSTTADLMGDFTSVLHTGDYLLFEEIRSPDSGAKEDANSTHRQVVRLISMERLEDKFRDGGIHVTAVEWDKADALTFPLCISSNKVKDRISVARGNVVLADHGRRIYGEVHQVPKATRYKGQWRPHKIHLNEGPLSFCLDNLSESPVSGLMSTDPHAATPQIKELTVQSSSEVWKPAQPNLLSYSPFDRNFAVEVDNAGRAILRFGDGQHGLALPDGSKINVTYRVGVGRAGNIGYGSLAHVIQPLGEDYSSIECLINPLPAWGGVDPEPMERVKLLAPAAFHADRLRAVTEEDYAFIVEKHPAVSNAVASFRWTGSWHTVFITIDPKGTNEVSTQLRSDIKKWVARYSQAGYDVEIDQPIFVPLEIVVDLCIEPDHFKGDVESEAIKALSNKPWPDRKPGLFHPDNFTFGQALYISQLYEAIESVEGVESASVKIFKRYGRDPKGELEEGYIPVDRLEVIRLDNDPNFPENGVLRLNSRGGR